MKFFFTRLWMLGVYEDQLDYIQAKVKISNQLGFAAITLVGIPFLILTYLVLEERLALKLIPTIGTFIVCLMFFFNYLNWNIMARSMISITLPFVVLMFHSYVLPEGERPLADFSMLQLSFAIILFIVFDFREWPYMLLIGIFNSLGFVLFPIMNAWLELDTAVSLEDIRILSFTGMFSSLVVINAIILLLVYFNFMSGKYNQKLMQEADQSKQDLKASEDMLKNNIDMLQATQEEEKKRSWANEGLAKFGEILRNNDDNLETVSYEILSKMIDYLGFNQGGIFVVVEEYGEVSLRMTACYAYDRKKFNEKKLSIGQGLIGQCIKEKESILLREIPENYVHITSGLGEATPRSILISPIKNNEEIFGAIELASFSDIEPHHIDFIERLSESIASTISSVKVKENTKSLLDDAQLMAEQMTSQEEEMRQNMEELQATQEEMDRRNIEMNSIIEKQKKIETELRKEVEQLKKGRVS